jgi:hypothetical protein
MARQTFPKTKTIDGTTWTKLGIMHGCDGTPRPLYRDDRIPAGQFAPVACDVCGYRKHGAVQMAELEAMKADIVAALSH